MDCVSERTVIASLFVQVPVSCLYGCLANCEVVGSDVREDNQWLVVGCEEEGCICDICPCLYYV